MKKLLNTLFVTSEDAYLTLDGENVVVNREKQVTARFPLHALAGIISFSYAGASPALMGACAKRDVSLSFCTPRGRFLARTCGVSNGNVLLRRTQYRTADDPPQACRIARMMVFGKIYNARWSIERTCRDHAMRVDTETLKAASAKLKALLPQVQAETDLGSLRGLEGAGAAIYFDVFDRLILNHKAGAWIEIKKEKNNPLSTSLPSRERGLKFALDQPGRDRVQRRSLRGSVD